MNQTDQENYLIFVVDNFLAWHSLACYVLSRYFIPQIDQFQCKIGRFLSCRLKMTITFQRVSVQKSCQLQKLSYFLGLYNYLKIYLTGESVLTWHIRKVVQFQLKTAKIHNLLTGKCIFAKLYLRIDKIKNLEMENINFNN